MSAETDTGVRMKRRESRLRLRGVDYCVHEWGDASAPLLVYLHGWGDTATTFQFVVDAFEHGWHVVAPDWRGFGDSRGDVSGYWFPDYLADLDALLAELSPNRKVALIGHSMGANVAGLYAGAMPERVSAFVNIEGFGLPDSDPVDAPSRYRSWIKRSRSPLGFSEFADFEALANIIRKRSPRMSLERALVAARCWARRDDGVVRLRADPLHRLPNPVLYRRAEAEACWQKITAPVLVVSGGDSEFRGQPFPNSTAIEIEHAGHMLHFETPEALAAAIETFLLDAL
jgi:pimeloyl-ACP methyl ester carboxylesterase